MSENTLALLIPAYNAAAFLPRLLRSAIAQTRPFDEMWVYDDCSADDTGEVARSFGARVIRGDVNCGPSYGRNILASRTSCKWLHFHDADDELLPNFVEKAHDWMTRDSYDAVLFGYEQRDETGVTMFTMRFDPQALATDPVSYAIRTVIAPFCGLYRRSAFLDAGGYDTDPLVLCEEDKEFHIRLALACLRFAADEEVLVVCHRRRNSFSSDPVRCARAVHHIMRKTAQVPNSSRYWREISFQLWDTATTAARHGDWGTAYRAAVLADNLVCEAPSRVKALLRLSGRLLLRIPPAIKRRLTKLGAHSGLVPLFGHRQRR